jgi:DNA polymerase III delta prime subunit
MWRMGWVDLAGGDPRGEADQEQVLPLILELAGGDLRKAITYLQTAQRLHGALDPPTPISANSSESMLSLGDIGRGHKSTIYLGPLQSR